MTKGTVPEGSGIETAFVIAQEGGLLAVEVSYVPNDIDSPCQGYVISSAEEMATKSKSKLPIKVTLPKEGFMVDGKYKDASG